MSDWITTKEAAELSGYTPDYLRELIRESKVKAQKWTREWQVSRKSLLAYLKEQEAKGERRGAKPKLDTA
jgi:excisionase family DNA binding protein